MHTSDSELMMVFEKVLQQDCKYCCVCLRTENETKLIEPKALKAFIATLNNKNINFTEETRVCIICEGKAKSALSFLKAAHLAVSIQELYTDMINAKCYKKQVEQHFSKINVKDHFKSLDQIEEQLQSWRAHTKLVFTEVLTIDNLDDCDSLDTSQTIFSNPRLVSTESENNKSGMRTRQKKTSNVTSRSGCLNPAAGGTVIILDDDELVEVNPKKKQNDNGSISLHGRANSKKSGKIKKRRRSTSVVHVIDEVKLNIRKELAISTNVEDDVIVPHDLTEDFVKSINKQNGTQGSTTIENPLLAQMLNTNNGLNVIPNIFIRPTICKSTGNLIFPDISSNESLKTLGGTQVLILTNNVDTSQGRPMWPVKVTSGDQLETGEPPVQKTKLTPTPREQVPVEILTKGALNRCLTIQDGKFRGVETELVKEPVPKHVKIDWEDKIPMDVISFIEANNQPIASSQINSDTSVGGITDVRSITEVRSTSDMMQDSEIPTVVDLCYLD